MAEHFLVLKLHGPVDEGMHNEMKPHYQQRGGSLIDRRMLDLSAGNTLAVDLKFCYLLLEIIKSFIARSVQ